VLSCAKDKPRHRRTAACQVAPGEDRGDSILGASGTIGSTVAASQWGWCAREPNPSNRSSFDLEHHGIRSGDPDPKLGHDNPP
jgi:hypothetical protein